MDRAAIEEKLAGLDGKGYKAYRALAGTYRFPRFTLYIDHVQADPFARPSRLRARVGQDLAGFPTELTSSHVRRVAAEDFIARAFNQAVTTVVKGHRGTGKSGFIGIDSGGQEILERTAAVITSEYAELRFAAGLPADGRRCAGNEASAMLLDEVPRLIEAALYFADLDRSALRLHVDAADDQEHMRSHMGEMGLVAFIADGSVLPRESGISDRPLSGDSLITFASPPELSVKLELPHQGRVAGMGIPEGVTLVVGGGYHGKSTLLRALERGVYAHIPGDGRELVATRGDAVKIRSEDGRRVEKVNISPFIANLPFGVGTDSFSTENASGSTSQATNIVEALEVGSRLLLIDEDTSATNFMIRDELMQQLIPAEKEPITPLIDQVRNLYLEHGVSTILVMGGSGDYFETADTIIAMDEYRPRVVTGQAREIAARWRDRRLQQGAGGFGPIQRRTPLAPGIDPFRGGREKIAAKGLGTVLFGRYAVDLTQVEQLVDESQTRAIGALVAYALKQGFIDGEATISEMIDRVLANVAGDGLEAALGLPGQDYALPRRYELAAMLNRLRSFQVKPDVAS